MLFGLRCYASFKSQDFPPMDPRPTSLHLCWGCNITEAKVTTIHRGTKITLCGKPYMRGYHPQSHCFHPQNNEVEHDEN